MAIIAHSSAPYVNSSELRYVPALQESECSAVTGFLGSLPLDERPSDRIINQIGKSETVKAQLVYIKNVPSHDAKDLQEKEAVCGVIVYEEGIRQPKSITIHFLRLVDDGLFSGRGITRRMLYKITSLAKSLQCPSVYALVNDTDRSSLRFFQGNSFHVVSSSSSQGCLLERHVAEEVVERKRHIPEPSEGAPAAKVFHGGPVQEKTVEATLKQPYLSLIKSGRKTIEGRIAAGMFARIHQGSKIRFLNQQDQVFCLVTRVARYSSFAQMLTAEGVDKCLPGTSLEAGVRIFDNLPGYKERAQKSGVLAIEVKVERQE